MSGGTDDPGAPSGARGGDRAEGSSSLARRLGVGDAVVVGLGAMLGAGVFAAIEPAAEAAGGALLVGLVIAGVVAWCNATSSAQLAALYPESGGTYVYGRERLGHLWGHLAGWAFVVGKTASCAAMAFTFGAYAWPEQARAVAVLAVVGLTLVNLAGVHRTVAATRVTLVVVLGSLAMVVASGWSADPQLARIELDLSVGPWAVLQSAGLLFFAFAGYARIATLGAEVRDPATTIPRAVPIALGATFALYALVAFAALVSVGPSELAASSAPLETVATAGAIPGAGGVVRVGATVATLGVLLSLLVGVSRTTFAMAEGGDLPRWFAAVHPVRQVPHRAELAVAAVVVALVSVGDLRTAIGFSSFAVLTYYAVANAASWTLGPDERRWPRWFSALGLVGCVVLAVALPVVSVLAGAGVLAAGLVAFGVARSRERRSQTRR